MLVSLCAQARAGGIGAPGEAAGELIGAALERAVERGWKELHLLSECRGAEGEWESAELWGSGVGIWNGKVQFSLEPEAMRRLLDRLRIGGFAELAGSYGGRDDPQPRPTPPAASAVQVSCRISLRLDGVVKEAVQLHQGRQSEELRQLAGAILDVGRKLSAGGDTAESLSDGLGKVASGRLAPETLKILLQRKPEAHDRAANNEGWVLRLEGRAASFHSFSSGGGSDEVIEAELSKRDIADLSELLSEKGMEDLPVNLYAENYTDLMVKVLDREKRIQARRFAGMSAETHGESQKRFEGILAELMALARRLGGPTD